MTPRLTFVATGRNDSYMGNFRYRLSSSVNMVARQAARLGRLDDVEFLVTDWGSEEPLADVLPVTAEAARICRFVYVPPDVARARRADDYYPTCAINTSVRRARGEYCVLYDADSLIPFHGMRSLLDLLDGRLEVPFDPREAFYFFPRHHIPWEVVQRELSVEEWDRYLTVNAGALPADPNFPGLAGSGAGQMLATQAWHELTGYNEALVGQGWIDVELALRATQTRPMVDLAGLGISLYHMEHWPRNRRQRWVNRVENPYVVSTAPRVNDDSWGLAGAPVQILEPRSIFGSLAGPGALPEAAQLLDAMPSRDTRNAVSAVQRRWTLPQAEWETLAAVSGFAHARHARTMLEFGSRGRLGAVAAAAAAPGIELFLLESWQGAGVLSSPGHLAAQLREAGHRGAVRYVTGPAETAMERLLASWTGKPQVDLACLWEDAPAEAAAQAARILAPGGMLAVLSPEAAGAAAAARPELLRVESPGGGVTLFLSASGPAPAFPVLGPPPRPALLPQVRRAARLAQRAWENPAKAKGALRALLSGRLRRR